MPVPKVSVLVPIYNVEKYIRRCAVSLFEQTLDDVEYVFVNDATPDNSMKVLLEVIEEYPKRKPYVKIVNHAVNKGLASTRNSGLAHATGEYVGNVDSDDWCETTMLEKMYNKAKEHNSDIVWCEIYYADPHGQLVRFAQECEEDPKVMTLAIMTGKIHGSVCNKLVRRKLFLENNLKSLDGINICEDYNLSSKCAFRSERVSCIPECLYYYNQGSVSLTKFIDRDRIAGMVREREIVYRDILSFMGGNPIVDEWLRDYGVCFWNKPYLRFEDKELMKLWKKNCTVPIGRILRNPYIRRVDKLYYFCVKMNVPGLYKLYRKLVG